MKIGVGKFGGSSFCLDEKTFDSGLAMVLNEIKISVLANGLVWIVVSAFAGVTRRLDEICTMCRFSNGDSRLAVAKLEELVNSHAPLCLPPDMLRVDLRDIEVKVNGIREEARGVVDRLCNASHPEREQVEATLLSFGERLATMVLLHRMRQHGLKVRYVPAYSTMVAQSSGHFAFRNANIDVESTVVNIREAFSRAPVELLVDTSRSIPRGIDVGTPNVVLTEGFIGRTVRGSYVTFGYDGSDLSAIVTAYAFGVEATLYKCVEGEVAASSIEELLEQMRTIEGNKGRLIGVKALEFALDHGVTIVLRDPRSGYVYRLEPRTRHTGITSPA